MDLFPVDTNIVACSRPSGEHESVVAGRVFEVPFEGVYDRVGVYQELVPFRCLMDRSNVMEEVFVPMVQLFVMMEDLNLMKQWKKNNIIIKAFIMAFIDFLLNKLSELGLYINVHTFRKGNYWKSFYCQNLMGIELEMQSCNLVTILIQSKQPQRTIDFFLSSLFVIKLCDND